MSKSRSSILAVVASLPIIFLGCQNHAINQPTTRLGVEADTPSVIDGTIRVDPIAVSTKRYTANNMDRIPIGSECEVKLATDDRVLKGTLASVENGTLVLSDVEEITRHTSEQGAPLIKDIPYVKRLFKNTGVAYSSRFLNYATLSSFEVDQITAHLIDE